MTGHNNIIVVVIVNLFVIFLLCCQCGGTNRIHNHDRLRRFYTSIGFADPDEEQRCNALCREVSCRREYIPTRARYILSCLNISGDPCARHRNGTLCEALTVGSYAVYGNYNPDSNQTCSYSGCSNECSMILQQLKETWGCCFHEIARGYYFHYWINIEGFTTKNVSHNYWHLCEIQPPEKCHYDIADITIDPAECTTREQKGHLASEYQCESLPQFLREAKSCAYLYYHASALCAIKDGKRCQELLFHSNYTDKLFAKARQDCSRTSDICSLGCKSTLQFLRDHVGCCLHVDNGTTPDSIVSILWRYGL